jgi:hypothetical protein
MLLLSWGLKAYTVASDAFPQKHLQSVAPLRLVRVLALAHGNFFLMDPLNFFKQNLLNPGYNANLGPRGNLKVVFKSSNFFLN